MAAEFGGRRQIPSLAYTLAYLGAGVGGIGMGWLADRTGPRVPVLIGGTMLGLGAWAASAGGELQLLACYGLMMGLFGQSGGFTPLAGNIAGWFEARRGEALALVIAGNALGGFVWPQVFRFLLPSLGWRDTLMLYGGWAAASMILLSLYIRPPPGRAGRGRHRPREDFSSLPYPSRVVMGLICLAGLTCCAPMSMPLVQMVGYCADLGIAVERGTEAVSLILLVAIASAFAAGRIAGRIGVLPVMLFLSGLQALALAVLQVVGGVPGLFLAAVLLGIPFLALVQLYTLLLRQLYGANLATWRLGVVMMFTLGGMALGGWLGGVIYDATLRYEPAFQAGIALNLVNFLAIATLAVGIRRRAAIA